MLRWIAWNIVFRLQERAKRHESFSILREMEAADRLSGVELRQLQTEKLREFIDSCYRHVPYVRRRMDEAGVAPGDIREPADLALLPLMTKADVRQHRESLRSDIAGKLVPFSTGGSTGEPLIFDLSKRRIASRVACRQRVSRWWGVSVGDPELALWGSPIEVGHQDHLRNFRDRLLRTRLLPAFEMNPATMSRYLDILENGPCRQIFAYPSAVYLLCLHARKEGRRLRHLGIRAVFVTGEVVFPFQRELISDTLNCPVANGYGGRDSGFIAHECPQGGMHLMEDAVVTEIVDSSGQPVRPGEAGEIVVTDLYSDGAPFLRYATGDYGVLGTRPCSCGRASAVLERVEGRSNDLVVTPDGRMINSLALVYPVREIKGIEQFRICQKTVNWFHVNLVTNQDFSASAEDRLRHAWGALLRSPVDVTFEYLPNLPADRSGKFRHVVSEASSSELRRMQESSADAPAVASAIAATGHESIGRGGGARR